MARTEVLPTGREVLFDESDIIVSKTDLKGKITYANDVLLSIAGYAESEVIGAPHHNQMTRILPYPSTLPVSEPFRKVIESSESVVIRCRAPESENGVLDVETGTSPCGEAARASLPE